MCYYILCIIKIRCLLNACVELVDECVECVDECVGFGVECVEFVVECVGVGCVECWMCWVCLKNKNFKKTYIII